MKTTLYYQGGYYLLESSTIQDTTATFNDSALSSAMTNVASLASYSPPQEISTYSDRKDSLKLVGTQLQKMDLWNPVLEYFDQYLVDMSSRNTHSHLMDQQRKLVKLMATVATDVANKYRSSKDKDVTADYRTTDDFQFRKVITVFRHYLYFVALYNLQFLEYLQVKVSSSEIFNKGFIDGLPKLYDPPKLKYIKSGYLNPSTNSNFNKNEIDMSEWNDELNNKAEQLSSGFSKNAGAWDFNKLSSLYVNGLSTGTVDDDSKEILIPIMGASNEDSEIWDIIDNIHYFVISNLIKLAPNLIRHSIKNVKKTSSEISTTKSNIQDKTKEIIQPYQKTSDYSKMASGFKDSTPTDKDVSTVSNATEYERRKNSILSKIKDKVSKK